MMTNFDTRKNMKPTDSLPIDNVNKPKAYIFDATPLYCPACGGKIDPLTGECNCS